MTTSATVDHVCTCHPDKPDWGPGPWQDEPDRVQWEHAGLPCIAHRGGGGAWCGYAAVPPGHPAHGQDYESVDVDIHGGLTYAGACGGCICHVPKPGEPDDVWWLGFDCGHARDLHPRPMLRDGGHYWTLAEVQAETNQLAEQLAAMSG